ncbi:FHA domain-containing protein [Mariniluteicoccus flavus]
MAPSCPAGHPSQSSDYCDVCGTPMAAASQGPAGAGAPSGSAPSSSPGHAANAPDATPDKPVGAPCPSCATINPPDSLFCEACGYDYTTGTMPRGASAPESPDPTREREREVPAAGQVAPPDPSAPGSATPQQPPVAGLLDLDTPAPPAPSAPQAAAPRTPEATPAPDTPAPQIPFEWIAEVWIDPEWYTLQQAPDPLPSPGLPTMVPLRRRSLLIGRASRSRNIHPDLDLEPDSGISRRQAQLSTDGSRWFVEDLDSANGTYVAGAAEPLPTTPIPQGRRRELDADDRVYLGAWTRIVLRRATPEEKELYA